MNRAKSTLLAAVGLLLGAVCVPHAGAVVYQSYQSQSVPLALVDASAHIDVVWTEVAGGPPGACTTPAGFGAPSAYNDDISEPLALGFTFRFGGVAYTTVRVQSNGRLMFRSTACGNGTDARRNLPVWQFGPTLRVLGMDVDPSPAGTGTTCVAPSCHVRYFSDSGAKRFIVTWTAVPVFGNAAQRVTMQVILDGNSGDFYYQYGALPGLPTTPSVAGWQVDVNDSAQETSVVAGISNTAKRYFIPAPMAVYSFEQNSYVAANSILDTSGANRHASPIGVSSTAAGKVCRGLVVPANSSVAVTNAASTPVYANTTLAGASKLGAAGTITFWYKSDSAWNAAVATLLDATLVTSGDKVFFLLKTAGGRLRFEVENTSDTNIKAESSAFGGIGPNEWHHIAITWNFPAGRMAIYLDGALVRGRTGAAISQANFNTIHLGDNRGTSESSVARSAAGTLDEVRMYNYEAGGGLIRTDMNRNDCMSVDHFAFSHSGSAVTCQAEPVTLIAHDANHAPVNFTGAVSLSTSTARGDWSLASGSGSFAAGASNSGGATYTFNNESSVALLLRHTSSGTVNMNAVSASVSETSGAATAGEDASLIFADAGFSFVDAAGTPINIGTQIAGKRSDQAPAAQTLYLQAVRTAPNGACSGIFGNGQTVTIDLAYRCENPTSCTGGTLLDVTNAAGTTTGISGNPAASAVNALNTSATPLLFGTNSQAQLSLRYPDAGQISLHAQYAIPLANNTPSGNYIRGSSNNFVVRPFALHVAVAGNPAASGPPPSSVFRLAGQSFDATLRAVAWSTADDANADGNPDGGADLSDNPATPNFRADSVLSPTTPITPAAGSVGSLGGGTVAPGAFANGATGALALSYSEAGSFTLLAASTDYLGATDADIGSNTLVVGRFRPSHYAVTASAFAPACASGNFSYARQPFGGVVTIEAQNAANQLTRNYRDAFVTLTAPQTQLTLRNSATGAAYDSQAANFVATKGFSETGAGKPNTGNAQIDLGVAWSNTTAPATSTARLTAVADEVATVSGAPVSLGSSEVRLGRLRASNAHGSELLQLPVPLLAQYFTGTSWVTNIADNCTNLTVPVAVSLTVPRTPGLTFFAPPDTATNRLHAGDTTATLNGSTSNASLVAGDARLKLSKPAGGHRGYLDVVVDAPAWLKYNWDGTDNAPADGDLFDDNPAARATFGVSPGSSEMIFLRENF